MKLIKGTYIPQLLKLAAEPMLYLPRKNLNDLHIFMTGYSNGLDLIRPTASPEEEGLWNEFQSFLNSKNGNAANVYLNAFAASETDEKAWESFFFELVAYLSNKSVRVEFCSEEKSILDPNEYHNLLKGIIQRPWMYLGCSSLTLFSIFVDGLLCAESNFSKGAYVQEQWSQFNMRMESVGYPKWKCSWDRKLLLMAGFDDLKAWTDFIARINQEA